MFKIRNYNIKDNGPLITMITTVLAGYGMSLDFNGPDNDLKNIDGNYFKKGGIFYIAESKGNIIGSVGVCNIYNNRCQLRKMYLLKDYRGQGCGRMLLEKAINFAIISEYKKMELEVSRKHKSAIHLYKKMGFIKSDIPSDCPRCEFIYTKTII